MPPAAPLKKSSRKFAIVKNFRKHLHSRNVDNATTMAKKKLLGEKMAEATATPQSEIIPTDKKVVLTANRVDRILGIDKGKAGVKSVLSPSAEFAKLDPAPSAEEWDQSMFQDKFRKIKEVDPLLSIIFALQWEGALRVAEVRAIKSTDIDALGRVTIRSKKGGTIRVISSGIVANEIIQFRSAIFEPFALYSSTYIYRNYKKFGIGAWFGENKKMSVTHLPRHIVALKSSESGRDNSVIKSQLGQKSEKSTEHYTRKQRGKKDS